MPTPNYTKLYRQRAPKNAASSLFTPSRYNGYPISPPKKKETDPVDT